MQIPQRSNLSSLTAASFAGAAALALLVTFVPAARGGEIIPSLGVTRAVSGGSDAKLYSQLAFREYLMPALRGEISVAYRSESRFDEQLKMQSWPVTASLYLAPIKELYAGAGVGWYQTTLSYPGNPALANENSQEFGVHVGGGMEVPLGQSLGVDLNGRYVMMRDQESKLVPEKFNPDFWTTSLGLAVRF